MKRVAITRALPEAEATAARIRDRGAEAILAPLLTIIPCGYDTNVGAAQALLFTSSNGVHAFPDARNNRDRPVFAVGAATAAAARSAGFTNVRSADGDVASLAALVTSQLDPKSGPLVHIAGTHVAGDLGGALRAAGFTVDRRVAYAAVAAAALPAALAEPFDVVLFHSARAAETFVSLGAPGVPDRIAACLSAAVAAPLQNLAWKQLIVASAPREEALLTAALGG